MGRVNIGGLRGLSASDRDYAEQEYLRTIQGWNALSDNDKDAFYRDDNFRLRVIDNNLSPQLSMEYFINRKDNYTPEYYREQLTNYLLGSRPATPEARDNRAWYEKLLGIGNDGTEDFSYRMKLAEQQGWDEEANKLRGLTNEQLQQRVLDKITSERANFTDAQREQEEAQRREREEKLQYYRGLSGTDRDRIYADKMFEDAFKGTKDWDVLKTLHPTIRDEIYNNPRYNATFQNDQGQITDGDAEDTRTWYEWSLDQVSKGLMNASLCLTPEYAKGSAGGLLGLADYLRGGEKGAAIGTIYGVASGSIWNTLIQGEIGGFGLTNASSKLQQHDSDVILDELHAQSNQLIKRDTEEDILQYQESALAKRESDPDWKKNLDEAWEHFTATNPVWQTFKDKSYTQLTDEQKLRIIAQTSAIANRYGEETAMQILNDDLNDIVSSGQGTSFLRSLEGAGLKFAASKGEKMIWLGDKLGINGLLGMDDQDTWRAMKYFDNMDKLGVLSSTAQEDIIYGTNTQAYKDFIAQGGTREQWIDEQEATGEYKGYGISPNKRVRGTGNQHNWFSVDGTLDAFEMSGYIADQATAQWALGKLTKGLGKPIGKQSRKINDYLLKTVGASPEARVAFQGKVSDALTRLGGYGRAYYGSIPISVGYGMAAYDEVRQKGLEAILGQINNEIDSSPEYAAEKQAILDRYGLIDGTENPNAQRRQQALMEELNTLRQQWIEKKRQEKAEDFAKLDEEAHDAYNMNFTLESLRNTGINLTYRSWLYKDATRAVRGGRVPLELPNFEKTLGKIGFKDAGKKLDSKILSTKFGGKFAQYTEDEAGQLMRNKSLWRNTAEYAHQIGKNVWGGFWSNYMDDVSVGFSAGFNLYDFNDYMQSKYNPESYNGTSDIMSSFLAGVNEGADKMLDKQSFTDGFIGAMGSLISVNPVGSLGMLTGLRNFTHDAQGRRLSKVEIANKFLGNPILGTVGMVKEERRATDERLNRLNSILAENGAKLTDTSALLHWAAARKDSHDYGDFLDMKDANDGLGFSILYNLAKLEEEGGHYGQVAQGFFEDLERLAQGGQNITQDDINGFLGNPENRHLLDEHVSVNEDDELVQMDDEGKQLYAQSQLQSNAQKLLDLNKKLRKNMANVKKAFGNFNINDDAAVQLAYSLTMQDQWQERLQSLNQKLADTQQYSTESNDDVTYRTMKFTQDRIQKIDDRINQLKKEIQQHQDRIDQLQGVTVGRALKKAASTKGSIKDKYDTYRRQRASVLSTAEVLAGDEQLETLKAALKGRKRELEKLNQEKKDATKIMRDRTKKAESPISVEDVLHEDLAIHDVAPLDEHQIMALNPQQRANILLNPETFSKPQQEIVKSIIKERQLQNPEFKTDVRDAAILYNRIQQNTQTINNIIADREGFQRYANTVVARNLMYNSLRYYNSDEYKALERNSQARKKVVSQLKNVDNNQRDIINTVIDYLQNEVSKGTELDLTNSTDILQLFDNNIDGIQKTIANDDRVTLETPNGTIDLVNNTDDIISVRDLLRQAIDINANNEAIVRERQQPVSVPQETVESQEKSEKPTIASETPTEKAKGNQENSDAYQVAQKAKGTNFESSANTILKYLKGEVPAFQMAFIDTLGEEGQREGETDEDYANRIVKKYMDEGYIEISQQKDNTPESNGRYQINPDVVIDRETANKELGRNYTEIADDEFVNQQEQPKLKATAKYLNGELTDAKEYLKQMGFATGKSSWLDSASTEEINKRASEISKQYGKYLKDTKDTKPTVPANSNTGTVNTGNHSQGVDTVRSIIDTIAQNYDGVDASTIEFYNPMLWTGNSEVVQSIKEMFRNLFGTSGVSRMEELLRKYSEMKPEERPAIYYMVPNDWHESMKHLRGSKYNMLRELPIVAVVEDSEGGITMELNGEKKTFTPIGLAPATSFEYENSTLGQHRTEPIRQAAIKEGVVQTNQIITDNNGRPVTSKLLRINRVTPPSMKKGIFKSIADIALAKLGFNQSKGNAEDIFEGTNTGKETSLYSSFRQNFLSRLTKRKNPKTDASELFYEYPYEGSTRRLQIFQIALANTMVEIPAGLLGDNITSISLFEAIQRKDASLNEFLLSRSQTSGSAMLKLLVGRIQYAFDKNIREQEQLLDEDNLLTANDLSKELTRAFSNTFNNSNNDTSYAIQVSDKVEMMEYQGQQVPHIIINLQSNNRTEELIRLPIDAETLDNNTAMDIIRKFLFEGVDGMGKFRGESESNKIRGLNWSINYTDLQNYNDAVNNQEESSENRAIVAKAHALFDDGILSVSQEGIPGVYPYLSAPFNTQGRPVISQQTSNSNNAGDLAGNTGTVQSGTITETRPITDVIKEGINLTIKKILDYSRAKREVIKQRINSQDRQSVKNHLSATSIAGILFDSDFSEDSPFYYPSTMIGTDADSFIRDFFITDDEGKFLFDKNAIDYSKYPTLSKSVLDEMVKGLTVLKQQMIDRGETRIISEEVITDGNIKVKLQDGRTIEVPNTVHLDMMTVDNMGKVHIYDMKSFRSDDAFQEKIFKNYATQLNIYKNLLESQYGVQVDSVHIIPIMVDYPTPSEQNVYSQKDGKLYLNDREFSLDNPSTTRIGMAINIDGLVKDANSRVQDEQSKQAEQMLKAVGFTQEEIERLKRGNVDRTLNRKKLASSYKVSLTIPISNEVTIDMESLPEAQKQKVNAIIQQIQKENGEQNPSQIASMKVEEATPTGIVINSDLQIDTNQQVPDSAAPFVGREIIGESNQSITEKKEEIDDTASCHTAAPVKGLKVSKRGRNIKL